MQTNTQSLGYRQFMWGLSNGIFVLAMAGAFWFALATWAADARLAIVPIIVVTVALAYGALRVRRRASGFRIRETKQGSDAERARTRRIQVGLRWVSLLEGGLTSLTVLLCLHTHREDLIWPGIALGVGLHFVPLARLVSVRPYYVAALCGSIIALLGLLAPEASLSPAMRTEGVGIGMGAVIWITAAYLSVRADTLVLVWGNVSGRADEDTQACRELANVCQPRRWRRTLCSRPPANPSTDANTRKRTQRTATIGS